jgi:hypothetical protein
MYIPNRAAPVREWISPRLVEFTYADAGALVANYVPEINLFVIADVEVHGERRQGIGKALLFYAKLFAEEQTEVDHVLAAIVSRECYDATARVFGAQHIDVTRLGTYDSERPLQLQAFHEITQASLRYPITRDPTETGRGTQTYIDTAEISC